MNEDESLVAASTLRRGATRLSRRMRLARGDGGLTQQQFSVLAHLRRNGACTPGDLAAAERIQPQSLTRALSSLESEGLITREPHPDDGRSSLLAITGEGLRLFHADVRRRDLWLASAMSSLLTATERELLRLAGELMVRLAGSAGPAADRADPDDVVHGADTGPPAHGVAHGLARRNGISYIHIPAGDVGRAARFYRRVFGWEVRGEDSARPTFDDGSGHVGGAWMVDQLPSRQPGLLPYIYVDDVDAMLRAVSGNGGEIVEAARPEGNLRIGLFRDPAGNLFGLWQATGD